MSNIKTLLEAAAREIQQANGNQAEDIRLEEYEKNANSLVISYLLPNKNPIKVTGLIGSAISQQERAYERIYKTVTFNDKDEVVSVKIFLK